MAVGLTGTLTCDAGYLVKDEIFEKIFTMQIKVYIAPKKNIKKIMTQKQAKLFKTRSIIETI